MDDEGRQMPQPPPHTGQMPEDAELERLLLEYVRSYSRFYSRAESKTLQRAREQLHQELEMEPLVSRLERICGPLGGAKVLELGSGSGSRAVAVALRGADVTGIEPSEEGVTVSRMRASRYPGARATFHTGAGEQLPYPDGSFDLVFSTEVLQHVQRLKEVVAESFRVLKPGGRCYHEAPNNLYPWEFHYRIFWIPGMPKPVAKLYARARGKDPRHLDDINLLYRHSLFALMGSQGFEEVADLYPEELARKARQVESIRSPVKRRLYALMQGMGIADLGLHAATSLGVYPGIRVHARKPV